jgi:hypothetical protein
VIEMYEAAGKRPTTFNIVAEVYQIEPDADGNRLCSEAQHVATKRALATLRRKGLVSGQQEVEIASDGRRILAGLAAGGGWRAERCCLWSRQAAPDAL